MINLIKKELKGVADPKKAKILQSFFKTKKGEYGYGDIFLGVSVPQQRKIAKKYKDLKINDLGKLLNEKIHEYRLSALIILIDKYREGNENTKKEIVDFYFKNTKNINNWDLVDISAPHILGNFFLKKDKSRIKKLAQSENLWERRIAIVSTLEFIKNNNLETTFTLSKKLLNDEHDLIHKATGWMLREAGKKDKERLKNFINSHKKKMPRTTLRYAIEKFSEEERKKMMK